MPSVEFDYKVYEDTIEIIPENGIKNNSVYEIRIKNVRDRTKRKMPLEDLELKVTTELTPSYCTVEAVRTIMERDEISDHDILYYIREASQFAEYASGEEFSPDDIPYYVRQFVKYRAAYDSLLKFYVEKAAQAGKSGSISEVSFDHGGRFPDINELLEGIKEEVDRWETHVRGFGFQGRAAPQAGIKGSGIYDTYLPGYGRKVTDQRSRQHKMGSWRDRRYGVARQRR